MTEISNQPKTTLDEQSAKFASLLQRADAAKIMNEVRTLEAAPERFRSYALLGLPNGRRTRQISVFPRNLDNLLSIQFEKFIVLGDYIAVVDTASGRIEAQIAGGGPGGQLNARRFQQLPGVEIIAEDDTDDDHEAFDEESTPARNVPAKNWRLVVQQGEVSIEISPASEDFFVLLERGITLKMYGITTSTHDESLAALERYGAALLFDLDLVYGLPFQLAKLRAANRRRLRKQPDHPPKFPRNAYAGQALELYQYGRTAGGLPLLEYLAYYQSVEYFFPFFAREQIVNSVRTQLVHPKFDPLDDAALGRLINLAGPAARGGMAEREQLRATIRACITEPDLRDFVESLPEYIDHFCSKSQTIKGVGALQLDGNKTDLRDQVADRIYAIRCRIVHAKQDGGGSSDEVLLPSSSEAASLQSDIELLRLVAQQALIARAARV